MDPDVERRSPRNDVLKLTQKLKPPNQAVGEFNNHDKRNDYYGL